MQFSTTLFATGALLLSSFASATPTSAVSDLAKRLLFSNGNPVYPIGIAPATYDGKCFYPQPAANFDPTKYVGSNPTTGRQIWYQLAAQDQFFEVGCKCVYAKYGSFSNGTVTVENFCTRFGSPSSIKGTAPPQPAYGKGTFTVNFGFPSGSCPGPNYIVQKIYKDSEGAYQTVIVSSSKFDGWFLLSKSRTVSQEQLTTYLKDVAALGNDLSKSYTIDDPTGCPAITSD